MYNILSVFFILFGLYAIIFPSGHITNMNDSYSVNDLLQGWGIYSVTLGLILYYPNYIKQILLGCFTISILWHINIININGYTQHHKISIIINIIAILVLLFIYKHKSSKKKYNK